MNEHEIDVNNHNELYCKLFSLIMTDPKNQFCEIASFRKVSERSIKDRLKWLDELSHSDAIDIYLEHKKSLVA